MSVSSRTTSRVISALFASVIAVTGLAAPAFATGTVSSTILTTGTYPAWSAFNPDGTEIAVANFGCASCVPAEESSVDFIDPDTNTVTTVTNAALDNATNLVWSADGDTVYVLNYTGGIVVIDANTHTVTDTLTNSGSAANYSGMAITGDGEYLITGNYLSAAAYVVDISADTYTTVALDSDVNSVSQIFIPNGGDFAYVVGYYGFVQKFNVANPASPTAVGELQFDAMDDGGTSVCQSFDGKTLFMADYSAMTHNIARLNLATGASISAETEIDESIGCAMTPDGKNVIFGAYGMDSPAQVFEFKASNLDEVHTYDLVFEESSDVIASHPDVCSVYVSNYYGTTNIIDYPCSNAEGLAPTGGSSTVATNVLIFGAVVGIAGIAFAFTNRRRVH